MKTRRVTVPFSISTFDKLKFQADAIEVSVNSYVKQITTNYLNDNKHSFLTKEQKETIREFKRVQSNIANNINQIARKLNSGELENFPVKNIIQYLRYYDDAFKKYIDKENNDDNKIDE